MSKPLKILLAATSHDKMGDSDRKTGVWLEEMATPYYIFKEAGAAVVIASPKGGRVPLDPQSQSIVAITRNAKRFLKDDEALNLLSHSVVPDDVKAADYDAVFLSGGHGAMWDFADNKILKQLLEEFIRENKPVGAVCHGVAGFTSLQNNKGESLIKGKRLTAFSNSEEQSAGLTTTVPFLLETRLVSLGALYSKGIDYLSYVVTDGNIVTGQNPASSEEAAKKIIILLQVKGKQTDYYNLSLTK
jgi:putative intracellular protease/amidase